MMGHRRIRYKPLKGCPLVTFVKVNSLAQAASVLQTAVPRDRWLQVQLWAHGSSYWLQFKPALRIDCDRLAAQAFIATGIHHQAAAVLIDPEAPPLPAASCLRWLEQGQLQQIEQQQLTKVSFSQLLAPPPTAWQPLWKAKPLEVASLLKNKIYPNKQIGEALSIGSAQSLAQSKDMTSGFVKAIATGRSMPRWPNLFGRERSVAKRPVASAGTANSLGRRSPMKNKTSSGWWQRALTDFSARLSFLWPFSFRRLSRGGSTQLGGQQRAQAAESKSTESKPTESQSRGGWLAQIDEFWRRQVARSQLGRFIGRRQAEYFHRMLQQFQQQNWEEALKMAVPLTDYEQALSSRSLPAFGLPQLRTNLHISRFRVQGGQGYGFASESYNQLRDVYQKAYEQLMKDSQFKQAAFVLAELLNRVREAVDLLAEKGFLQEAAEIAEGRLPHPDKAIRLWLQGGDIERAMALAIRTNAFQAALVAIKTQKHNSDIEKQFELLWMRRLVRSGDYERWFNYCARDTNDVRQLQAFFKTMLPSEFLNDPAWLARASCVLPWEILKPRLSKLFADPAHPDFSLFWHTFFEFFEVFSSWKQQLPDRVLPSLAKELYRQALTYQWHLGKDMNTRMKLLRSLIADPLFLQPSPSDVKNPFVPSPPPEHTSPHFVFQPAESLIKDIGLTRTGRICVALGALGTRVYGRDGKLLNHFSVPSHRLVSPLSGAMLLAIEEREKLHRIHRIYTHTLEASWLAQQELMAYSRRHNGQTWPITSIFAGGERVALVDIAALKASSTWGQVWNSGPLAGHVGALVSGHQQITFTLEDQVWQYRLPQLKLNFRRSLEEISGRNSIEPINFETLRIGEDGQLWWFTPVNSKQQTGPSLEESKPQNSKQIECYRLNCNVHSPTKLGRIQLIEQRLEGGYSATESQSETEAAALPVTDLPTILYSDGAILITSLLFSNGRSQVCAYQLNSGRSLALLFTIESSSDPVAIQTTPKHIAIAQHDQVLLFDRVRKSGSVIRID